MNLYEFNKSIISQINTNISIPDFCNLAKELKNKTENKYYMLFNKEIGYFTLFSFAEPKESQDGNFGEIILSCLINIAGDINNITSADFTEDNSSLEIWIKDENNVATMFYLFPYDMGVVPTGGSL